MAKKPTEPTKTIKEWRKELQALLKTKDFDTLLIQAEICIQEYPNLVGPYLMHGIANGELGRPEEAIKDYDKAIELEPDDASAYNNRGNAKGDLGHYEGAIKDYDQAIKLDPNDMTAIQNKSLTFAKIEAEKSKEEFQKVFLARLNEIERKQKEQLAEITDPEIIINKYQSEIDETRYRLYGKNILYHTKSYKQLCDETKCKISKMEGLVQDAQAASKRSRYVLIAIAIIVIVLLIFTHAKHDTDSLKNANILELLRGRNFSPLTPLNLLQFTTITFLIYSPFLFHARYLARQAKEETVRLHSLIRERNRILFWQAQSNDTEQTNKARLATDVLKYMDGNSTADISLRMMDRPLFSRKSGKEEISLSANDVLHALKNLTLKKSE